MAEAHAMMSLVEQGWADQNDVARVFGYAARTLRRQQRRFEEGGLAALGRHGGYPLGRPRLATSRIQRVGQDDPGDDDYAVSLLGSQKTPIVDDPQAFGVVYVWK